MIITPKRVAMLAAVRKAYGLQDPFTNPAWKMTALTDAINILPNQYGRLNQLNLFPARGVRTRTIQVEEKDGILSVLASRPLGARGDAGRAEARRMRSFVIPHFPHEDGIDPADVQDLRAFGSEDNTVALAQYINERLQQHKNKHDITLEYLRMGALKGTIVDGGGVTLLNLFTEYGISQGTTDFLLGTAGTNVREKCMEVLRGIEDNLLGEVMQRVHVLVSPEFFDKLVKHASVEAAYAGWTAAAERLGGDLRTGFPFGGLVFEEYRGTATLRDGTTSRFIAAQEGHAFPIGTQNAFATYFAPADFNETVNTVGLPYYSKVQERAFQRGYDMHSQSNPLPLCLRPKLLWKVHTSN